MDLFVIWKRLVFWFKWGVDFNLVCFDEKDSFVGLFSISLDNIIFFVVGRGGGEFFCRSKFVCCFFNVIY